MFLEIYLIRITTFYYGQPPECLGTSPIFTKVSQPRNITDCSGTSPICNRGFSKVEILPIVQALLRVFRIFQVGNTPDCSGHSSEFSGFSKLEIPPIVWALLRVFRIFQVGNTPDCLGTCWIFTKGFRHPKVV